MSTNDIPYWQRPVLDAEERVALSEMIASEINKKIPEIRASAHRTPKASSVYVAVAVPGIDGGVMIDLPQDENGVLVSFPRMRQRKVCALIYQAVAHLEGQFGSKFEVPSTYPIEGRNHAIPGWAGGAARIEALGPDGVAGMMASVREKRWAPLNELSLSIAQQFDVIGLARKIEDVLSKDGVAPYQRALVRKRVAKMLADYVSLPAAGQPVPPPENLTASDESTDNSLSLAHPYLASIQEPTETEPNES